MASYDEVITALRAADAAGNTQDASRLAQIASGLKESKPAPVEPEVKPVSAASVVGGPAEAALSIGSSALSTPVAGLAGLAQSIANFGNPGGMSAADRVRQIQESFTYQPRTDAGQSIMKVAALPGEAIDYAGGKVTDVTGSPAMGAAVATGLSAIPMALGGGLVPKTVAGRTVPLPVTGPLKVAGEVSATAAAEAAAQARRGSVKTNTFDAARKEGFVAPPSATGAGSVVQTLEGIGGRAATAQEALARNQEVASKIGRREAGLAEDSPMTTGTLETARNGPMSQPYRDVAALSPLAARALENLKQRRVEAKLKYAEYDRQQTVTSLREAEALDAKATMYENAIERIAARQGSPDLVKQLREARTAMAKNYDVERALNIGSGELDPAVLGRMHDKNPRRLTGGLKTIAEFYLAFPRYARDVSGAQAPGVGATNMGASAHFGMLGHSAGMGWLGAGIPLVRGPVRSAVLSGPMQGVRPPGAHYSLSELLDPRMASLIPVNQE